MYGKIVPETERKKKYVKNKKKGKKYGIKSTGKSRKKKYEKEKVREKNYGKIRAKSKGKSHVTSGDVTSGQACAMVRSSGFSTNTN